VDEWVTERLRMRPFAPDDVEHLVALNADPEVMRYLTGGEALPRDAIVRDVLPSYIAPRGHIGWFSLRPRVPGPADEAELGYRLIRAAWGRGLATEGASALIAKGFGELGLMRIFAETMAVNVASRRVLEKAGLTYVRTYHQQWAHPIPGTEHGEVEYEIRRQA
jgi:RimJ/RimL family protein N-acetyltransferase